MSGGFGALENGAVYEWNDDGCTCCSPGPGYPHEAYCGRDLVGFLPNGSTGRYWYPEHREPDLLPTTLWDFSHL